MQVGIIFSIECYDYLMYDFRQLQNGTDNEDFKIKLILRLPTESHETCMSPYILEAYHLECR